MKIVTNDDIRGIGIHPFKCYEWVGEVIKNKRNTELPPKISLHMPDGVFCNIMPSMIPENDMGNMGGVKVVNRYPKRQPSLDSKLLLMDMDTGDFLALMDSNWITAMRTGAVCAHSVMLFAKSDFSTISFMGLGNTARASLLVLAEVLKDKKLNIRLLAYKGQEQLFIDRFKEYKNLEFSVTENVEELIKGSDVVISCVTYFEHDICKDEWFDEGVLIVPVHTRGFTNCDLFFDKVFADDTGHVCHFKNFNRFHSFSETCDVVNGIVPGRENDKERILVYNIGLSIHDIYFASKIYHILNEKTNIFDFELGAPKEKFWV